MKTSFTKKRKIAAANIMLENRYLMKEQLLSQANATSVLDDPNFFANNMENLAATYTTPPGETQPESVLSNTTATHYIPGDKTYKYIKNNDGTWSAIRLSDQKIIPLKDNVAATQKLNSQALTVGTKPPKKSDSVSSSKSSVDTIDSNTPSATSEPSSNSQQTQNQEKLQNLKQLTDIYNLDRLANLSKMIANEIYNKTNSDETKIINLLQTIRTPEEMDLFINTYKKMSVNASDLARDLFKTIRPQTDRKEYKELWDILSRLGYTIVPGKALGIPYQIVKTT